MRGPYVFQREYLAQALRRSRGNIAQAALGMRKDRRALGRLLQRYGLSARDFRSSA
jgi:transcriptional regulator with GAF, ATPase, and Fis domain